jgi:vesicle coat complex subunit
MHLKFYTTPLIFIGVLTLFLRCDSKKQDGTSFTRIDSLTDMYLVLQDSLLDTWNLMIKDDNQKIKAMKSLLHELEVGGQFSLEELYSLEQRIDQLIKIRYTPKTMWNADVVEEYDFASNSLVTELISLAESHSAFSYNKVMQQLVEDIRAADLRVEHYRTEYDVLAMTYNSFLEDYHDVLKEIDETGSPGKKPLFQMTSE